MGNKEAETDFQKRLPKKAAEYNTMTDLPAIPCSMKTAKQATAINGQLYTGH